MNARYDLVKVSKNFETEQKEDEYQARYISRGTIDTELLFKEVTMMTGFKRGQLDGILSSLLDSIIDSLEKGYDVQLGDFGFFSLSATSPKVKSRKEIRAESIRFNGVRFRTSAYLRKQLRNMRFEKVEVPVYRSAENTSIQRAGYLKNYLKVHKCITRAEYERLTGSLRKRAIDDLNHFIAEGWIEKHGAGRTIVYMLS